MPPNTTETKTRTIVVNGREHEVSTKEISYEEVLDLAPDVTGDATDRSSFTVTFRRGQGNKPSGTLAEGGTVKVKEGMIFDVGRTDRS